MSKVWQEVKIYVDGAVKYRLASPMEIDPSVMRSIEEKGTNHDSPTYMTPEVAEAIADELIRFAQEMKSEQLNTKEE